MFLKGCKGRNDDSTEIKQQEIIDATLPERALQTVLHILSEVIEHEHIKSQMHESPMDECMADPALPLIMMFDLISIEEQLLLQILITLSQ